MPELSRDALHAVQLLGRQMEQDGLEQFKRVKRFLTHFVAVRSLDIGSSPSTMNFRPEERMDSMTEPRVQECARVAAVFLLQSQSDINLGLDRDHSPLCCLSRSCPYALSASLPTFFQSAETITGPSAKTRSVSEQL